MRRPKDGVANRMVPVAGLVTATRCTLLEYQAPVLAAGSKVTRVWPTAGPTGASATARAAAAEIDLTPQFPQSAGTGLIATSGGGRGVSVRTCPLLKMTFDPDPRTTSTNPISD